MRTFTFLGLVALASCQLHMPSTGLLRDLVDKGFVRLDHAPQDNKISESEWDAIITADDTNKDGCVTEAEFQNVNHVPVPQIAVTIFNHFDYDKDGCMKVSDMLKEFEAMDTSGDGVVSRGEFDSHFENVVTKAFATMLFSGITG